MHKSKFTLLPGVLLGVFVLDRIFKYIVFERGFRFSAWIFDIDLHMNDGIAFSIPFPRTLLLIVSVVLLFVLVWYFRNYLRDAYYAVGVGMILGGALSNILDRLLYGAVIDYIGVWLWPIFNVADAGIVIGVFIVALKELKVVREKS